MEDCLTPHRCDRLIAAARATLGWLAAALVVLGAATGATQASPADQSVAYQLNPGHNGHMADAGLATPLAQAWSITLPGAASYPLIVNGRVYVTSADRTLYARNQATGAAVWSRGIGGTYPWSALAYDRGRIFVLNVDGLLTALDAETGAVAWSKQMPGQYSFSSAPTAVDGVVYLAGAGSGGTLYAVRESDGRVLWTRQVANGDQSSPAVDEDAVYVTYACHQDYAFARTTGAQLWHNSTGCSGGGGRTPVRAGDVLIARDGAGFGAQVLSAATGEILGPINAGPAPAVAGGVAYALSSSTLTAVAQSGLGVNLWQFTGDGDLVTAPLAVGGRIFAGSSSGMLYAVDPVTGTDSWSANVGASIQPPDEHNVAGPLTGMGAANGTLVVPAGTQLVAYRSAGAITQVPENTGLPTIDGTPQSGQLLAADVGIWSGLPSAYAYQWQRCNPTGDDCADVAGATGATFTPADGDAGITLRLRVVATNGVGASLALTSAPTASVLVGLPVNLTPPAISGSARQNQTLTASPGTWTNSPSEYAYRWQRCSLPPWPLCADIAGATASTYVPGPADTGHQIVVRVIAANDGGESDEIASAPTSEILPIPVNTSQPHFSGDLRVGGTLFAQPGHWTGDVTSFAYQWFSCDPQGDSCPNIAGATGTSYLVQAGDLGRFIGVEVVATGPGGDSEPANSDAYGPVPAALAVNQAPPAITGIAQVGQTLSADPGGWTGSPSGFSFQWYECDAAVVECGPIPGATAAAFQPTAAETGRRLGVGVIATNAGGESEEAFSDLTAAVRGATPLAPVIPPAILPATPPPPATRAPDSSFTTLSAGVRANGSIVINVLPRDPGTLTATASAGAAALAKGCRTRCRRTGRGTYGRGRATTRLARAVTIVVKPTARARAALRRSRTIRVRVTLRFASVRGGPRTTRVRSFSVRGGLARRSRSSPRVSAGRVAAARRQP